MPTIILLLSLFAGADSRGKEVTTCDLVNPTQFEGTVISLQGQLGFSMHGAYFLTNSCRHKISAPIILFPNTEFAARVDFDADGTAAERLKPFLRVSGGSSVACGTLTGRLFIKPGFHLKKRAGALVGNGFGPSGRSQMAFVIKSVNDIGPCR